MARKDSHPNQQANLLTWSMARTNRSNQALVSIAQLYKRHNQMNNHQPNRKYIFIAMLSQIRMPPTKKNWTESRNGLSTELKTELKNRPNSGRIAKSRPVSRLRQTRWSAYLAWMSFDTALRCNQIFSPHSRTEILSPNTSANILFAISL